VNMLELLKTLVMIILLLVRRCKFELKDERGSTYHVKKRFELLNTLAIVLLLCGDANTTVNKHRLRLLWKKNALSY